MRKNSGHHYHVKKFEWHWDLVKEGAARASICKWTKNELIAATEAFMSDKKGSVRIHRADGTFQEERTYTRAATPKKSAR